jgi:hypothetical protein
VDDLKGHLSLVEEGEVVEIEVEEAESDGVYYLLDHQTSVFWQVGAAVKHADVAGGGSKIDGKAEEEQKSEVEVGDDDVDKQAEPQVGGVLPGVHMVESKRLTGKGCMLALGEVDVVELQQASDTGGGVAAFASYSGSHNHNLHTVHSVLQAVAQVETLATEHYKAPEVGHVAVASLLRTTKPSNLADLAEVEVDQGATGAAEAYNLGLARTDFCSSL